MGLVSAKNALLVEMDFASRENSRQNSSIVWLSSVPLITASGIEITTLRLATKQLRIGKTSLTYQTGVMSTTMMSFMETTEDSQLKRERTDFMLQCALTITGCMKMLNVETLKALIWMMKKREAWPAPMMKMKKQPLVMMNNPLKLVNKINLEKMRKTLKCPMKKI